MRSFAGCKDQRCVFFFFFGLLSLGLGLFPSLSLSSEFDRSCAKTNCPIASSRNSGPHPPLVILHIALSVWRLTGANLRGRAGLLLTPDGSRKQIATCLADEDITTKLCTGRHESPGRRHRHVLEELLLLLRQ